MKRFRFLFFAIITLFANCMFIACSDDKDSPDNPDAPGKGKCVISEVALITEDYSALFSNFRFDKEGRITDYKLKYSDQSETYGDKYTYSSSIIRVEDNEGEVMATYILDNGLIVSAQDYWDNRWEYIYDSNKHITTIKEYNSPSHTVTVTCNWENNNLISYTYHGEYVDLNTSITYTDTNNSLNIFPVELSDGYLDCDDGRIFDAVLCSEGYFGNMPAKLPSTIVSESYYDYKKELTYSDFNKYGYPSTMKYTSYDTRDDATGITKTYKFTWSK